MKLKSKKYYLAQFGLYNITSLFMFLVIYRVGSAEFVNTLVACYLGVFSVYVMFIASLYCLKVIDDENDA